jgi:hypothetical protein
MVAGSMRRRLRWLLLAVVVLAVIAAVVAVVTVQPDLSDARDRVDRTWAPLRAPLVARYQALAGVELTLAAAGGSTRTVTRDLQATLIRWQQAVKQGDAGTQATLADALEALAQRVKANFVASGRLRSNAPLSAALTGFDQRLVSPPAVAAYNRAVRAYEPKRRGAVRSLVASVFGFDGRPVLVLGS